MSKRSQKRNRAPSTPKCLLSLPRSSLFRIFRYLELEVVESVLVTVSKKCYKLCFAFNSLPSHRISDLSFSPLLHIFSSSFLHLLSPYLTYGLLLRLFPFLSKTCYTIFLQYLRSIRHANFNNEVENVILRILYLSPSLQTLTVCGYSRLSSVTICALAEERDLCPNLSQIRCDKIPQITSNQLTYLYRVRSKLSCILQGTHLQPEFMELSDILRAPEIHFQFFLDFIRPLLMTDLALFWRRVNSHETQVFSDPFTAKQQILKIWLQFLEKDSAFEIKVDRALWDLTKKWVDLIRAPGATPRPGNRSSSNTTIFDATSRTPSERSVKNTPRRFKTSVPPSPLSLSRGSCTDGGIPKSKPPTPLPKVAYLDDLLYVPAFELPSIRRKSFFKPSNIQFLQEVEETDESKSGRRLSCSNRLRRLEPVLTDESIHPLSEPLCPSSNLPLCPSSNLPTSIIPSSSIPIEEVIGRRSPKVPSTILGEENIVGRFPKISSETIVGRSPKISSRTTEENPPRGTPKLTPQPVYEPLVYSASLSASSVVPEDEELSVHPSEDRILGSAISRAISKTNSREEDEFFTRRSDEQGLEHAQPKVSREDDDEVLHLSASSSALGSFEATAKTSRDECIEIDQPPVAFVFSVIQDEIYYSFMKETFPAFKRTPQYQEIIRASLSPTEEPKCLNCCTIL